MYLIVQGGRKTPTTRACGYERDTLGIIVRRRALRGFPLGQNDQRGAVDVESRIHRRRAFFPSGESESHVRSVSHAVGRQDAKDGIGDIGASVHVFEAQGFGGTEQSIQVLFQVEYSTVVNSDSFPRGCIIRC